MMRPQGSNKKILAVLERRRTCFGPYLWFFIVLWGLGLMTGYTLGGVIHALLVIAIIVVLIQVIQGRRHA
jgi:hypothetical protein